MRDAQFAFSCYLLATIFSLSGFTILLCVAGWKITLAVFLILLGRNVAHIA